MLETSPPAAPTSPHRSRFGRLGEQGTRDGSSDAFRMLDAVTGLRDSRALWRELGQRAASCCASSPLAILVFDFDRFGELNERYDRSIGDAVLRRCAEVAALEAPSPRLAFRYRDDELVVLVPGDEEDGREAAERIRDQIAGQNHALPAITVSCGVAVLREAVEPLVAVGKSGPPLQAAKHAGGNRVVVANELDRNTRNGHAGETDGGDGTARRAALAMAVASLEARDRGTAAHSEDVVTLCESIGTRLGLSDEQLDRLAATAQLHDVGKLAMPTEILNKPGPLDEEEWEIIRQHTVIGERMLRAVPEMGAVAGMVRHSHERWDGDGYPDGLAGDEIPLASRIVLCADAFHAIRSDRPYRAGRPADAALAEVRAHAGAQFDPRVVDALVAVARDVRRAGVPITLPRARRLAALLAALAVVGGGSAYAASDDVRTVVDRVVRVIVPGTVLEPEDADAADFSLRPIDQVPDITPVDAITSDLEFPELRGMPYGRATVRAEGEGETGVPTIAVSGGSGYSTNEAVAFVGHPVAQPEAKAPPQSEAPQAPPLVPPASAVPPAPSGPITLVAQPDPAVVPTLAPVPELEHLPAAAPPAASEPSSPADPPAVGNPHGEPPGQAKEDDDAASEDVQPEADAHPEHPEHPHADGDLPPGPADVVEANPDHPHAPPPSGNVVTPTPAEPVVIPPETPAVPAPPVPAMRPPEYAPDELLAETPTSE